MEKKHLVIAYNFHPKMGSEEAVGWCFSKIHASYTNTAVYTQKYVYEERLKDVEFPASMEVRYFAGKGEYALRSLSKYIPMNLGHFINYFYWHFCLFLHLKGKRLNEFSLCHIVTWVTVIYPLATLWLKIPTLWGPLGGVAVAPMKMYKTHGPKNYIKEWVRSKIINLAHINPLLRASLRRVKYVICAASDGADWLQNRNLIRRENIYTIPGILYPENMLEEIPKEHKDMGENIVITVAARLLAWKGIDILLESIHSSGRQDVTLKIYGEGPYRSSLEALSNKLGLENIVEFYGRVNRDLVIEEVSYSDVFILPSLHDSEAGACMEALAVGTPVITTEFGGIKSCLKGCKNVFYINGSDRLSMIQNLVNKINLLEKKVSYFDKYVPDTSLLIFANKKEEMVKIFKKLEA